MRADNCTSGQHRAGKQVTIVSSAQQLLDGKSAKLGAAAKQFIERKGGKVGSRRYAHPSIVFA